MLPERNLPALRWLPVSLSEGAKDIIKLLVLVASSFEVVDYISFS